MTTKTKEQIVGIALLALLIWPVLHFQLTQAYRISPWKLWGWAMYCQPSGQVVTVLDAGGRARPDLRGFDAVTSDVIERFTARRHALGLFVTPDEMARAVSRVRPQYRGFIIRAEEYGFDERSFLNVIFRVDYRCQVSDRGEITVHPEIFDLSR